MSLAACGAATADEWGTLKGKFVLDGKAPAPKDIEAAKSNVDCNKHKVPDETIVVSDKGELSNIFVYLRTKDPKVAPSYKDSEKATVSVDNKECRFVPHCLVYRVGQTLSVHNSDPFGHNSNIAPLNNPGFNPIVPVTQVVEFQFKAEEALPTKMGCSIHPWMGAWVLIRKDPYATVSGKDGAFEIKDLPAGKELEFQIWSGAYLKDLKFKGGNTDTRGRFKITIKPGDSNDLGEIKIPISALQ